MSFKLPETGLFIDGKSVAAGDMAEFDVFDPASEQSLAKVASATVEDAKRAVDAAERAAAGWAATPPRKRAEILRRAFELMAEREDYLARLITLENGKALPESVAEVRYAAEFLRWYSEESVRIIGEFSVAPGGANRMLVSYHPVGVALLVTPWNFPAAMVTRKIGPALAAGCTTVLKPASETPLTALALAEIFAEAGVPAGVVNVVPTRRTGEVVSALLDDDRVRKLSFTGSTEVGVRLIEQAARQVIPCSMELGGNAPFIVLDDADLEVAVASAVTAKLRNGGQSCTAANRFYVARPVLETFTERLAEAMRNLQVGPGLDDGVHIGPLVNAAAVAKVDSLVADAVARGARVISGGSAPEGTGYFYTPTVLADVPFDARIVREEIFGPVAPIVAFDSLDEVVELANSTPFGLVSFIQTTDLAKGLALAERIEAGMVGINRGVVSDAAAPFGGWKQSGLGIEGGHAGLMEYLETKYIAATW